MSEETSVPSASNAPAGPLETTAPIPPLSTTRAKTTWFQRLSSLLFVLFCFELGLFLLIYPWISAWSDNYFAWAVPQSMQKQWNIAWNNAYLRGAVSGLGVANVWIALVEIFRLFTKR